MNFENTDYYHKLKSKKITLPFGNFYLTDKFIVAEINEGEHFEWEHVESLIPPFVDYYGENFKLAYISNRVNSYSYDPQSWMRFEKEYDFIVASAIVSYHELNKMNASLDKLMSQKSIKRCDTIKEAIKWVLNLEEFKNSDVKNISLS